LIPISKCTTCEHFLWDDKPIYQPVYGDLAVCVFCGAINEFDKELNLIAPTYITEEAKQASQNIKKMNERLAKYVREKLNKIMKEKRDNLSRVEE
jgi:hypothetical protein